MDAIAGPGCIALPLPNPAPYAKQDLLEEAAERAAAGDDGKRRVGKHPEGCGCIVCAARRRALDAKRREAEEALARCEAAAAEAQAAAESGDQQAAAAAAAAAAEAAQLAESLSAAVAKAEAEDAAAREKEREEKEREQAAQAAAAAEGGPGGSGKGGGRKGAKWGSVTKVLTAGTAAKLRERLELMALLRRALSQLPAGWQAARQVAKLKLLTGLPGWWTPQHDGALVKGMVGHGYGNWMEMSKVSRRGDDRRG